MVSGGFSRSVQKKIFAPNIDLLSKLIIFYICSLFAVLHEFLQQNFTVFCSVAMGWFVAELCMSGGVHNISGSYEWNADVL